MIGKFSGVVEQGAGRGTVLGYPTANISVSEIIPTGIYAGYVIYDTQCYPAAIFCGSAETFNDTVPKIEAYILDFSEDLYKKTITVELYKKIRDSKKFETTEQLVRAIEQDIKDIRICLQA